MRSLMIILMLCLITSSPVLATVTPIRDIQFTEDVSGASPLVDQIVTIQGTVTAEPYAYDNYFYFVQDDNAPWSGIKVFDPDRQVAQGDKVTLTGKVAEYYGTTEILDVTEFTIEPDSALAITPMVVNTGDIATGGALAESLEGCLVQIGQAQITNADLGYGEWQIDDGSGSCRVGAGQYFFVPANYSMVQSVTGPLDYSYSNTKILPRLANDIIEEGPYTRIQRIQHVRYSDLLKAPNDHLSDSSYMDGDTVMVRGVITLPTRMGDEGAGIKFIVSEPEGGPWSAILSYHPDSTAYPNLYEGDYIEMSGYVDEYTTNESNMTELWMTSPINILSTGNSVPPIDSVATGDLRQPVTAEKWGNVFVHVGNATVVDVNLAYELFAVDDGTGSVAVDDASNPLANYEVPPLGTIADSIRGWVYHNWGSYGDSTTYKLTPVYVSDIVWGIGPPAIKNTQRDAAAPASQQLVTVSTEVTSNLNITAVTLYYRTGEQTEYNQLEMQAGEDDTYHCQIPAHASGQVVHYYVEATDENGQISYDPAKPALMNYSYKVLDRAPVIADIQYTPWSLADSPFEGQSIRITGIVTTDPSFASHYSGTAIQDAANPWSGLIVFGALPALERGDRVSVYGTITDYNPDWHFKWDNNTVLLADPDSLVILEKGAELPQSILVSTGDLASNSQSAESYEGCLVRITNATITSINDFDFSVDDGSGVCLIDDDAVSADILSIDPDQQIILVGGDTLRVGDRISSIQGVFIFSFGSHKIEIRDAQDLGQVTAVQQPVVSAPLTYELEQNFPNPFNPETRIYFSIPQNEHVQLVIYNLRGQLVRNLLDAAVAQGKHIVNWNGRDNSGSLVPSGVYIYRIKAGSFIHAKRMLMIK